MLPRAPLASCIALAAALSAAQGVAAPGPLDRSAAAAPVLPVRGCHEDVQRHHVPELRDTVPHRHLRGSCRPVPERKALPARDCHRDVRRHFVPGAGVILHRHVGEDCAIRRVNRSSEPKP
jgi:hypothetical protein